MEWFSPTISIDFWPPQDKIVLGEYWKKNTESNAPLHVPRKNNSIEREVLLLVDNVIYLFAFNIKMFFDDDILFFSFWGYLRVGMIQSAMGDERGANDTFDVTILYHF